MECQGDYIQWLDADDLLAADKIERQLTVAERQTAPDVLFASAWAHFYFRPQKAKFHPTALWQDLDAVEWLVLRLGNPWMMCSMAWLVSRRLADKAGSWDDRLKRNQDGEYFCRVVSLSRYVKFVSESRCYYRMANLSSVTSNRSRKAWESLCLSIELEIRHVLAREDSEFTRTACVKRLNMVASILDANALDLADRLRRRIIELGGKIVPESTSRKYALVKGIVGERNARFLKEVVSRTHRRIYCRWDKLLSALFGRSI